ncbi:MAG: anhydro-N-acetylmuramic acid kinase, partial [Gemmatimonadetes bacterium]|nr:anhydro-N-acetylmuramic acid kinase [Gemmatimonadota bacterium]
MPAQLRLAELAAKERRRVVGLMSGTSADGIDAVLVDLWGCGDSTRYEILSFNTTPLPSDLRREVFALFAEDASLDALCRINFALGEAFATAALAAAEQAKLSPESIDLIGSHGQTVRHLPASGATLQIGEPAVIAARTGAVTIADFRAADMAVGGEGAPLVPLVDHLLFAGHEGRLLLNIGGIANITALPPNADASAVRAFDLGPGNMLIDAAVAQCTGGREHFDRGGARAARGRVDEALLAELMRHSFLQREPPKSTGREEFGEPFLAEILRRGTWSDDDLIATLTAFTVQSIAEGIR